MIIFILDGLESKYKSLPVKRKHRRHTLESRPGKHICRTKEDFVAKLFKITKLLCNIMYVFIA